MVVLVSMLLHGNSAIYLSFIVRLCSVFHILQDQNKTEAVQVHTDDLSIQDSMTPRMLFEPAMIPTN